MVLDINVGWVRVILCSMPCLFQITTATAALSMTTADDLLHELALQVSMPQWHHLLGLLKNYPITCVQHDCYVVVCHHKF